MNSTTKLLHNQTKDIVDKISDRVAIVVSGNGLQQWSKVSEKCQAWLSGIGNLFPKVEMDYYQHHLNNDQAKCNEITSVFLRIDLIRSVQ